VVPVKLLDEDAWVAIAGAACDCLDGEVSFSQELAGFGHSPFDYPSLDGAPGLAADDLCGQVPWRQPNGRGPT
jgi:hypothetical protein